MARYKFKQNLIELSDSTTFLPAIREWEIIMDEKRPELDRLCICQHKIKYVTYMCNLKNGNLISVGTTCVKKFSTENIPICKNRLFIEFMTGVSEYGEIEDTTAFTENNKRFLYDLVEKQLMNCKTVRKITELETDVNEMIFKYKQTYLENLLERIVIAKNFLLEKEREEKRGKERIKKERMEREEKERIERERMEREREEQEKRERMERERIERERKEQEKREKEKREEKEKKELEQKYERDKKNIEKFEEERKKYQGWRINFIQRMEEMERNRHKKLMEMHFKR